MSEEKKKIEAVLFTTGRLMTSEEISTVTGINLDAVKNLLAELKNDYDQKDSAMTVQQVDDKFKLNIKKEYGQITNKLVSTNEMDSPTTKTLAVIAFKNPVLQSDIIKIRGNKAYDHITILRDQGLISAEKHGRTRLLKLTPKFFDYFDTAEPAVKEKFKEIEEKYKEASEELKKDDQTQEEIKETKEAPPQVEPQKPTESPTQEQVLQETEQAKQDTNL